MGIGLKLGEEDAIYRIEVNLVPSPLNGFRITYEDYLVGGDVIFERPTTRYEKEYAVLDEEKEDSGSGVTNRY